MATSGMQSGMAVGTVKGVNGMITAVNANGVIRVLKAGDTVYAGETIQSANGSTAHIDFTRGGFATLGAGQSLPLDGMVLSQAAEAARPQTGAAQTPQAAEANVEELQQQIEEALAKGEDPTALLEAAAAGPGAAGGGGAQEGGQFVLVEQLAARGALTPGFDTGTFGVAFPTPEEYTGIEIPGGDFDFGLVPGPGGGGGGDPGGGAAFDGRVYEDAQPYRHQADPGDPALGDRSLHAGEIQFAFTPTGTTVVTNIHLSGFDPGTRLYLGDPAEGGVEIAPNADGSYDLSQADFDGAGVYLIPPLDSDGDMTISAVVDIASAGGATGQLAGDYTIVVDAVADRPENVSGEVSWMEQAGELVVDGSAVEGRRADGWDETTVSKAVAEVNDGNVTATGGIVFEATFYDVGDTSETHTLYVEVPSEGRLGYIENDQFQEFARASETIPGHTGEDFYIVPDGVVTWVPGADGSAVAQVDCFYEVSGETADMTNDINLDLQVLAKAEETNLSGSDLVAENNVSWNESAGGANIIGRVDAVDSALTIRAGWASEGNDDSKHQTESYDPNYGQVTGDADGGSERGAAGVDAASTKDAQGAPVTLDISGSATSGVTENITSVVFTFPAGKLYSGGDPLADGDTITDNDGNAWQVGINGNEVTIIQTAGDFASWTSLDNLELSFAPDAALSHADESFGYRVSVESSEGARAVYEGSSTIVMDAVADRATGVTADVDYNGGDAAAAGETVTVEVKVSFPDTSEHKYVVLEVGEAQENGWTVGQDGMDAAAVDGVFRGVGGDALPSAGLSADGQYVVLEVTGNATDGWTVVGINADGSDYTIDGASVTESGGMFTVGMPVKAPEGSDVGESAISATPVTVVDQATLGGEEYDYGNNLSVGEAADITLIVSGVHSGINIGLEKVYEGSQPDKNMGKPDTAHGGKITLAVVPDADVTNNKPDALKAIVLNYDDTHGKISLNGKNMPSGSSIVFSWETDANGNVLTDADGNVLYTEAKVLDASGDVLGTITVPAPGHSLDSITASLKYTPATGDLSDTDVDIDYIASIVDPVSGGTRIVTSDGWEDANNSGNHTLEQIRADEKDNQDKTSYDDAATATVVVDAVADKPGVGGNYVVDYGKDESDAPNMAAGNGDTVKITTPEVTFRDYADNSENHYLLIGNKGLAITGDSAFATVPDQTITLKGGNGATLTYEIVGGKIVSIDGVTQETAIDVHVGEITDPNATGVAGFDFIRLPVSNEFLEKAGGKVTAEVEIRLPEGMTTDQTLQIKAGGMAGEMAVEPGGVGAENDGIRSDNNTSWTFKDGTVTVNVSNGITATVQRGYEDGFSDQNTNAAHNLGDGSGDPFFTFRAGPSDHILGTESGEIGQPVIVEFDFAGEAAELGVFERAERVYSLGNGIEKTGDHSYKLTIPAAHLPSPTAEGTKEIYLRYEPRTNDDTDLTNVRVTMWTHADNSPDSAEQTAVTIDRVVVDAVADDPVSEIADVASYHGNEAAKIGAEFTITVKDVQFQDYADGSESHTLMIQKTGIKGTYEGGGETPVVALANLGDQTITINGGNGAVQTITIADGKMTIVFGTTTYDAAHLPDGWTSTEWNVAQTALVNGTGAYFRIPVLNEFLEAAGGKVTDAAVEVKLPDGAALEKDATLTVNTGAMAFDKETDEGYITTGNNTASDSESTPVRVGVVTSEPTVSIGSDPMSENLTPGANTGNEIPTDGVPVTIGNIHTGESAEITLTFSLKDGTALADSYRDGDVMRVVDAKGGIHEATTKDDGKTWTVTITLEGGDADQTVHYMPGYNYNDRDIDVAYEITVTDTASGAEKTWQNTDDKGENYQDNALGIEVDAVAQIPGVTPPVVESIGGAAYVEKNQPVTITGEVTFRDAADGSEKHYVLVEINEDLGKLQTVKINGEVVSLEGATPLPQGDKLFYQLDVPKDVVGDVSGGEYTVKVEASYMPKADAESGQTIHLGGLTLEDNAPDLPMNAEDDLDNNTAIKWVESDEINFSQIGSVGITADAVHEGDHPDAYKGDPSPEGGTTVSLTQTDTSKITEAKFTYDNSEGDLFWEGKKLDPANPPAGVAVTVGEDEKTVTVTFDRSVVGDLIGDESKLSYVPNENSHSDGDVSLDYNIRYENPDTGQTGSSGDKALPILVDAVAEMPVDSEGKNVSQAGSGDTGITHGEDVTLELSAVFDDLTDNSENHFILVELQPNTSLKVGNTVITETFGVTDENGDTILYYKVPVTPDADGLAEVEVVYTTSGSDKAATDNLTFGALAEDKTGGDRESSFHNNVAVEIADDGIDIAYKGEGGHKDPFHIGNAYEDNMPDAHKGDGTKQGAPVSFNGAPEEADKIVIKVPKGEGVLENAGTPVDDGKGNWVYTVNKGADGNWPTGVEFRVDEKGHANNDGDINVSYKYKTDAKLVISLTSLAEGTDSIKFTNLEKYAVLEEGPNVTKVDGKYVISSGNELTLEEAIAQVRVVELRDPENHPSLASVSFEQYHEPGAGGGLSSPSSTIGGEIIPERLVERGKETVIVDAVADMPVDVVSKVDTGVAEAFKPTDAIKVSVSATFGDTTDGSESHFVLVEHLPGVTVKSGDGNTSYTETIFIEGKSYVKVQVDNASIGPDGKVKVDLQLELGAGYKDSDNFKQNTDGTYTVTLGTGALAVEPNTGKSGKLESEIGNNTAWTLDGDGLVVTVSGVDSAISVNVAPAYEGGINSDSGAGAIAVTGLATGKNDVMTEFKISCDTDDGALRLGNAVLDPANLPTGITVETGADGKVTFIFTDANLISQIIGGGLQYVPSGTGHADTALDWSATVKDTLSGDVKSFGSSSPAAVVVDAVANAPTVAENSVGFDANGHEAATSGGEATASITLNFADTDASETHYAILEQHTGISCKSAVVNGTTVTDIITFYGKDGQLYYAVEVPSGAAEAKVVFNLTAKETSEDIDANLKIGGVSIEKTDGLDPADREATLTNNRSEINTNEVTLRIGAVETDGAKLQDAHLVEGDNTATGLVLTATDGTPLSTVLEGNHEKIVAIEHSITQSGYSDWQASALKGTTVGQIVYGDKTYDLKIETVKGGVATISLYDGANKVDTIPVQDGFDFSKDSEIRLDPGYHNSNSLTVNTTVTVEDASGTTKDLTLAPSTVTIAATADAATNLAGADLNDAKAIAGHMTEVSVKLEADFADADNSELHYFYVKVEAGVEVVGGALLKDTGTDATTKADAGFDAGDRVYRVNADANNQPHTGREFDLKVPGDSSADTTITVVAVSEERAATGAGSEKVAYSGPTEITVDILPDPNLDGVVNDDKAPKDILDTVRGETEITGKTLLPTGYVTDKDTGDVIKVASVKAPSGDLADVSGNATDGWTVKGTYGEWTVKADGSYTYTLDDAHKGVIGKEELGFTVTDGHGWEKELTNTLKLEEAPNQKPTAKDAAVSEMIAEILEGTFSFNDANRDLVNLTAVLCGSAVGVWNDDHTLYTVKGEHGTLIVSGDPAHVGETTTYSYDYHVNESGLKAGVTDSFIFKGEDNFGGKVSDGNLDIKLTAVDYDVSGGVAHDGDDVFGWQAGVNIHGGMTDGVIHAGDGDDTIAVTGDGNVIHSGGGADTITVTGDHNTVYGEAGNDIINIHGDTNLVFGGTGDDTINIHGDANLVFGGAGDDTINLLSGQQTTISYAGGDLADVSKGDTIVNFRVGGEGTGDILDISELLSDAGLGNNSASLLDGGYLKFDPIAQTPDGKTTVTLSIDVDGAGGAGEAVKLATVVMDGVGALHGDAVSQAQNLFDQLIHNDQIKF